MGSGSSRLSSESPRRRRADGGRRLGLAACLCGGTSLATTDSSGVPSQRNVSMTERQASGKPYISARLDGSILNDSLRISVKEPSNFSHDVMPSISNDENMRSNQVLRSINSESFPDFRNSGSIMSDIASSHEIFHPQRSSDLASSSRKPDLPELRNVNASLTPVLEVDTYSGGRIFQSSVNLSHSIPQLDHEDHFANGIPSIDDPSYEVLSIQNSDSESISSIRSLSSSWQFSAEEPQGQPSSALNALASTRSWERMNGNVRHVDLVSIPSNVPGRYGEINNNEARRNNRRLLWDGFSRRSSRRTADSLATVLSSEDADDLESQWLLDISHHAAGGLEDDSLYFRRRRHGLSGLSWHSRPEIRGQVQSSSDHHSGQPTSCPSGIHPNGPCSCSALLMPEVSNTRASIARIVMLAEALFEVLDEIHHQPGSVSLSMVSVPAPESVVNSLPSKVHEKRDTIKSKDDVEQCYICLAEYEDGDEIRVLPCHHEYHMSCVDKWLKEIHGVCPLCRGAVETSVSAL